MDSCACSVCILYDWREYLSPFEEDTAVGDVFGISSARVLAMGLVGPMSCCLLGDMPPPPPTSPLTRCASFRPLLAVNDDGDGLVTSANWLRSRDTCCRSLSGSLAFGLEGCVLIKAPVALLVLGSRASVGAIPMASMPLLDAEMRACVPVLPFIIARIDAAFCDEICCDAERAFGELGAAADGHGDVGCVSEESVRAKLMRYFAADEEEKADGLRVLRLPLDEAGGGVVTLLLVPLLGLLMGDDCRIALAGNSMSLGMTAEAHSSGQVDRSRGVEGNFDVMIFFKPVSRWW